MDLYLLPSKKSVRNFAKGKEVKRIRIIRPDDKTKAMYSQKVYPQALVIEFTDGSSMQLDTWIGNFKPKTGGNDRQLSYITALLRRSSDGLAITLEELKKEM